MKKAIKLLNQNDGNSNFITVAVIFFLLTFLVSGLEYSRLQTIAQGTRDKMESIVAQACTANYDRLYNGVREGYSGAYQFSNTNWTENIDSQSIYQLVNNQLGTQYDGNSYIKYNTSGEEFRIENLQVKITHAPFAEETTIEQFTGIATYTVVIPMSFGWESMPPVSIPMKVQAGYRPKF